MQNWLDRLDEEMKERLAQNDGDDNDGGGPSLETTEETMILLPDPLVSHIHIPLEEVVEQENSGVTSVVNAALEEASKRLLQPAREWDKTTKLLKQRPKTRETQLEDEIMKQMKDKSTAAAKSKSKSKRPTASSRWNKSLDEYFQKSALPLPNLSQSSGDNTAERLKPTDKTLEPKDQEDGSSHTKTDETISPDGLPKDISMPLQHSPEDFDETNKHPWILQEFIVDKIPLWPSESIDGPRAWNCYGVVHVRVLAAQRLPCPVGSSVLVGLSLWPWKGRVRNPPATAFRGPHSTQGVCVDWTQLRQQQQRYEEDDDGLGCSMVHAYNSSDTPTPTIRMDLLFQPIHALLEFTMASVAFTAQPLMEQPSQWKKQWLVADINDQPTSWKKDETPLVLVEAAFFPATNNNDDKEEEEGSQESVASKKRTRATHNDSDDESDIASLSSGIKSNTPHVRLFSSSASTVATNATNATSNLLLKNRTHFLRVQSLWVPARCMICSRSITGWKSAHRCELCRVDCCSDCRIRVDLQMPCGSEEAKNAVASAPQTQWTLHNILTIVAPDESYHKGLPVDNKTHLSTSMHSKESGTRSVGDPSSSVGWLRLSVDRARLYTRPFPLDTDLENVFEGDSGGDAIVTNPLRDADHYVRVSWSGSKETKRTRTIQSSGNPLFESDVLTLAVPHYGMVYRMDVIDAATEKSVGTTLLTAQSLLQRQRDTLVYERGYSAYIPGRSIHPTMRRQKYELRQGIKPGFGSTYFLPGSKPDKNIRPGAIIGWISLDMCLEENMDHLFGPTAQPCPPRPTENLDLAIIQTHFSRIGAIIGDLNKCITFYGFVIGWERPMLTFASLCIFVWTCLMFDTEYIGSLPLSVMTIFLFYLAINRRRMKDRFIDREIKALVEAENDSNMKYSLHRPLGRIDICVQQGKNLKSRELGLPGSVGCRILWDPLRGSTNSEQLLDPILKSIHEIGETGFVFKTNPVWDDQSPFLSAESKRIHEIMESAHSTEKKNGPLVFCLVQPIREDKKKKAVLAPWNQASGAIVIQVRFRDVLSQLPGLEETLGEVVIPLSKIVDSVETRGWFPLRGSENTEDAPRIYVHMRWNPPDPSCTDREASILVQEEMVRWSFRDAKPSSGLIGAINSVRGITGTVQSIQNGLGGFLDQLERARNVLNFTEPSLSCIILIVLMLLWLVFILIPTRYIILFGGLAQYAGTFFARFFSKDEERQDEATDVSKEESSPIATWIANAFQRLPTDDDLRKAYFWEGRMAGEREAAKMAAKNRVPRLDRVWEASWFSVVHVRFEETWERKFGVLHGHRLLLWDSEHDFDGGNPPERRIVFSGHAGLGGLSPLEVRSLAKEILPRTLSLFGRGLHGQEKVIMLLPNENCKLALQEAIMTKLD